MTKRAGPDTPLEHIAPIIGRVLAAVPLPAEKRASCAECGDRPAQRFSLFCKPCEASIAATVNLYGEPAA